jgi:diguanylate cyclase (GGDEF)-like protein
VGVERDLLGDVPLPVLVLALDDGRVLYGNPAALAFFADAMDRIDPAEVKLILGKINQEADADGIEVELPRPSGETAWVLASSRRIEYESREALVISCTDITGCKKSQESFRDREEASRRLLSMLEMLHQINIKLTLEESRDDVCRKTVELGRSLLGFDRLGIWFVDENNPEYFRGTFGTGENGELRDERDSRVLITRTPERQSFYDNLIPVLYYPDVPQYDDSHRVVGRGESAMAPIWDGIKVIGEVTLDNFLNHREIAEEDLAVLIILARIVGQICRLKSVSENLRLLAFTDPLTGAVNRRTGTVILEKQLSFCERNLKPLVLCYVDIDGLKEVNDNYGHSSGDELIKVVSSLLARSVRTSDTVARIGGDEFIIVFPDCSALEAEPIMYRVQAKADGLKTEGAVSFPVRFSFGLEEFKPGSGSTADDLMQRADRAMYIRKRKRKTARAS